MPLERLEDDQRVTTGRGVEFWMADEVGSLVFCRVSHEALRDQAARVHFEGTDDRSLRPIESSLNRWQATPSTPVSTSMRQAASSSPRKRSLE
jgi:hypothetical protein